MARYPNLRILGFSVVLIVLACFLALVLFGCALHLHFHPPQGQNALQMEIPASQPSEPDVTLEIP